MAESATLEVVVGDITRLRVDVVVNAANPRMLGGGGVDGAIHRAAGPQLLAACHAVAEVAPGVRCPTGEARVTPAFDLPARWVVHTVGPVWSGGTAGEPDLLAACYRNALGEARRLGARSIAFPAISTGVYGYPKAAAATVAVGACRGILARASELRRVVLVAFHAADAAVLRTAVERGRANG